MNSGNLPIDDGMIPFSPEMLRAARTLARLTTAELAARAGLDHVTVRNYGRGLACPPQTWARLVRVLRVALGEQARGVDRMQKKLAA